jgi:hypothetical protein
MTGLDERCDTLPDPAAHRRVGATGETVDRTAEQTTVIRRGGAEDVGLILWDRSDHHAIQRLRRQLVAVLDTGAPHLTMDVSGLTCCDESCSTSSAGRRVEHAQQGWLALIGGRRHFRFTVRWRRLED